MRQNARATRLVISFDVLTCTIIFASIPLRTTARCALSPYWLGVALETGSSAIRRPLLRDLAPGGRVVPLERRESCTVKRVRSRTSLRVRTSYTVKLERTVVFFLAKLPPLSVGTLSVKQLSYLAAIPPDMRRDVQEIFRATPHHKQVMMFSATLAKDIRVTCKKFMANVCFPSTPSVQSLLTSFAAARDLRR